MLKKSEIPSQKGTKVFTRCRKLALSARHVQSIHKRCHWREVGGQRIKGKSQDNAPRAVPKSGQGTRKSIVVDTLLVARGRKRAQSANEKEPTVEESLREAFTALR